MHGVIKLAPFVVRWFSKKLSDQWTAWSIPEKVQYIKEGIEVAKLII